MVRRLAMTTLIALAATGCAAGDRYGAPKV
jgi:hypothetical protein